ncbi:MAG TPA: AAA family ATPase [Terracidiphilus sp.]|jgi:DNA polymerase III delta prime subunit
MLNLQPTSLEELVLKPDTRKTLELIVSDKLPVAPNGKSGLLLYGPPGTGKTTAARMLPSLLDPALAKRPRNDISSSSTFGYFFTTQGIKQHHWSCGAGSAGKNRGITLITEIENVVKNGDRGDSGFAYIILDEVDELVDQAMGSLRSHMDRYENVVWIFTTNHLDKMEPAVVDRSYRLEFGAADASEWAKRCNQILFKNDLPTLSAEQLAQLYDRTGSGRSIMSRLQAVVAVRRDISCPFKRTIDLRAEESK